MRETEVTKFPNYRWDSFRKGRGSWEGKLKIDAGAPVRCWRKGLSWRGGGITLLQEILFI